MKILWFCSIAVILLLSLPISNALAQQSTTGPEPPPGIDRGIRVDKRSQTLADMVPAYNWHHGCGPTAVGMVVGFWDLIGPDLVPGDASTQTTEVNAMIADDSNYPICGAANSDHYQDYSCPIDYSPDLFPDRSETGGAHTDICVGDYMKTSQSAYGNRYGWSWFSDISVGFTGYLDQAAPGLIPDVNNYDFSSFSFEDYKAEIDNLRPVVFLVDTDGDGSTDHFVTGVAYDEATTEYGIYDTWDSNLHWFQWRQIAPGISWGIYGVTTFGGIDWTRPYYVLDTIMSEDTDGDLFHETGDTIQVYFSLINYGMTASGAVISLTSDNPDVVYITQSINFAAIDGSGASTDNAGQPLEFIIPETINPGYDSFFVTIESDGGSHSDTFGFEEVIGRARVLLVDDEVGDRNSSIYSGDLYTRGVPVHIWNEEISGFPTGANLSQYNTVIWYTGDSTGDFIQPGDILAMENYMDTGGNLFLTGQGLAGELHNEDSVFLDDYLHARYNSKLFWYEHQGIDGSPIGDGFSIRYYSGANQVFTLSEQIFVEGDAIPAFRFDISGGGYSALSYDGDYKLVFFSWGYEAILNDSPHYETRDEVLTRILFFLDAWVEPPCVDSDGDGYGDAGHPENVCMTDNCPDNYNPSQDDYDLDDIGDLCDNCIYESNSDQEDGDSDGDGDVCDDCTDTDADGYGNPDFDANTCEDDNCADKYNPDQEDYDADGIGDSCDNCIYISNPDQADSNDDGIGDLCEYMCGDANGNRTINILDVTFIVNYLYKGGAAPDPLEAGDADGGGSINILDVTCIINYLYKGGPEPVCPS